MKMYEKLGMSTEDALKWAAGCRTRNCRECPAYKTQKWGDAGTECVSKYLLSDVPELPKSELVDAPESKGIENNLEKLQVGDEVESVISGSNGVVVDCHVPNIDGEDKYTVVFKSEIADCSRQILAKTGKKYATFTEYLREVRNG